MLISTVFRTFSGPLEGAYAARGRFKEIAKCEFYSYSFGYFFISCSLAYFGFGYWALGLAIFFQAALYLVLLKLGYKHEVFKVVKASLIHKNLKFGFGVLLARVASFFSSQGDNIIINKYMGSYELGVYGRAYQLMVVPTTFVGQVMNRVLIPKMSQESAESSRVLFFRFQLLAFIVSISIFLTILWKGNYFVRLVLGEGWGDLVPALTILSASIFYRLCFKFCESKIISGRKSRFCFTVM